MVDCTAFEYENVNGFKLSLQVDESGSPKSITFTVKYKNNKVKVTWPKLSLMLAMTLYFVSSVYVYVSWYSVSLSAVIFFTIFMFWATHSVQSESLTVIPTVGLQSSVKYVFGKDSKFVPWSSIDDVIINEVIKMNCVLYYLTVLVKCETEVECNTGLRVVPLFKYTKPRLQMIEKIYSEIRHILMKQVQSDGATSSRRGRKNADNRDMKTGAGDNDLNEQNVNLDKDMG